MSDKEVIVYTAPGWPWCNRAKEFLSRKGISYLEYDIAKDTDKAKEMVQKSKQMGVPVITVDNEVIVGFNQTQLNTQL